MTVKIFLFSIIFIINKKIKLRDLNIPPPKHTYIQTHTHIHTNIYTHTHTCKHIHTDTHTHTHTHAHTHTLAVILQFMEIHVNNSCIKYSIEAGCFSRPATSPTFFIS